MAFLRRRAGSTNNMANGTKTGHSTWENIE
jgi:hypothetical protein